jgi:predicted house-cleaning noncanonical NTP pyrophosphatase (MazG superfamily)
MRYNKLVRDKIPKIIKAKGEKPVIHVAEEEEYWEKLKEKLLEEVNEFREAESPEEIGDILEAIDAICEFKKFDKKEIKKIKKQKKKDRGGFKKRIILEEA